MALQQERNYGIDLLRIVAMYMVTTLHVLMHGGALMSGALSGQYLFGWFLEYAARGAVNLFALISGYVGIRSKYRVSNLAVLWLQVLLYSFGIAAFAAILRPNYCSPSDLIGYAFPVITKKYWYFSAYVCLFVFMPLLNAAVNTLSERSLRRVVIAMFLVFSVAASAARELSHNPFGLGSFGFCGLWLMILYVIGAYIRKYGLWKNMPRPALIGIWLGCTAASLGFRIAARQIGAKLTGEAYDLHVLLSYYSPFLVVGSVALLLCFSRLTFGSIAKRTIAFFAPAAFGVYIIHLHPIIWDNLLYLRFASYRELPLLSYAGAVMLTALAIFTVCIFIDLLRIRVFKLLHIRQHCLALEERLLRRKEEVPDREKQEELR